MITRRMHDDERAAEQARTMNRHHGLQSAETEAESESKSESITARGQVRPSRCKGHLTVEDKGEEGASALDMEGGGRRRSR